MSTPQERAQRKLTKPAPLYVRRLEAELEQARQRIGVLEAVLQLLLAERPTYTEPAEA